MGGLDLESPPCIAFSCEKVEFLVLVTVSFLLKWYHVVSDLGIFVDCHGIEPVEQIKDREQDDTAIEILLPMDCLMVLYCIC